MSMNICSLLSLCSFKCILQILRSPQISYDSGLKRQELYISGMTPNQHHICINLVTHWVIAPTLLMSLSISNTRKSKPYLSSMSPQYWKKTDLQFITLQSYKVLWVDTGHTVFSFRSQQKHHFLGEALQPAKPVWDLLIPTKPRYFLLCILNHILLFQGQFLPLDWRVHEVKFHEPGTQQVFNQCWISIRWQSGQATGKVSGCRGLSSRTETSAL